MLPLSQRPAIHHGQAYRPAPASRALPGHRCHYNVYALPYSRLRCLSFQGAITPATGKQPPSKEPPGAAKLTPSSNATSSGKQFVFPTDKSQATEHGKGGPQSQDAGTTATAAGEQQQQQERVQASENASTSGREYWQVRTLACHLSLVSYSILPISAPSCFMQGFPPSASFPFAGLIHPLQSYSRCSVCCEVELSEEDSTWILSLPQELLSVPEIDGGSVLIARARSA